MFIIPVSDEEVCRPRSRWDTTDIQPKPSLECIDQDRRSGSLTEKVRYPIVVTTQPNIG